jgi:hypothetical protein
VADSPNASRSRCAATLMLWSNSTTVPSGQSLRRISDRLSTTLQQQAEYPGGSFRQKDADVWASQLTRSQIEIQITDSDPHSLTTNHFRRLQHICAVMHK